MGTMKWKPAWWSEDYDSGWDRAKEALRRDWEQTKHDLHIKGGHQLNQGVGDTVKQAAGKEQIPSNDGPIPPKVIGEWNDIELPMEYGYGARSKYGSQHTAWTTELEVTLQTEWESARAATGRDWPEVREHVRRGYESRH
jgi:hypothetical protein